MIRDFLSLEVTSSSWVCMRLMSYALFEDFLLLEILKSFPFNWELLLATESGAGRARVFYFPKVARVFSTGVRVFSGPSLVSWSSWFRLIVMNLRMNS